MSFQRPADQGSRAAQSRPRLRDLDLNPRILTFRTSENALLPSRKVGRFSLARPSGLNRVALSFAPARLGKTSALRGIYTMIHLLETDVCMAEGAE